MNSVAHKFAEQQLALRGMPLHGRELWGFMRDILVQAFIEGELE